VRVGVSRGRAVHLACAHQPLTSQPPGLRTCVCSDGLRFLRRRERTDVTAVCAGCCGAAELAGCAASTTGISADGARPVSDMSGSGDLCSAAAPSAAGADIAALSTAAACARGVAEQRAAGAARDERDGAVRRCGAAQKQWRPGGGRCSSLCAAVALVGPVHARAPPRGVVRADLPPSRLPCPHRALPPASTCAAHRAPPQARPGRPGSGVKRAKRPWRPREQRGAPDAAPAAQRRASAASRPAGRRYSPRSAAKKDSNPQGAAMGGVRAGGAREALALFPCLRATAAARAPWVRGGGSDGRMIRGEAPHAELRDGAGQRGSWRRRSIGYVAVLRELAQGSPFSTSSRARNPALISGRLKLAERRAQPPGLAQRPHRLAQQRSDLPLAPLAHSQRPLFACALAAPPSPPSRTVSAGYVCAAGTGSEGDAALQGASGRPPVRPGDCCGG